jgi:hypothetical protein
MTDLRTAAQQALEALEKSETLVPYEGFGMLRREAERKHEAAITALRAALEQPEQEPVDAEAALRFALAQRDWAFKQLHAQPDRREWRSLNEEEIWRAIKSCGTAYGLEVNSIARAIEAALRSKNHE